MMCAVGGKPLPFGSQDALEQFAQALSLTSLEYSVANEKLQISYLPDRLARQRRMLSELQGFLRHLVFISERERDAFFHSKVSHSDPSTFAVQSQKFRQELWGELIGRLDEPMHEIQPRSRLVYEQPAWLGYEVVLDVWPDVFTWGILCLPRDIRAGERRPVIVCQHGLEGSPVDTIEDTSDGQRYYHRFSARLAERGFIVFAPHNPYRGGYRFKQLQRKANPLKASLGSVIIAQHTQILNWLESLSFVDPARIAFYGLSYGGWTAVRISSNS